MHVPRAVEPPSTTAPVAPALQAPSLRRRMGCWLYEGLLLFAVLFFAAWLFSALAHVSEHADPRRRVLQAVLLAVAGMYFSWSWAKGQTLPMKTWKIRVVDATGRPLNQIRALRRFVCSWLWFLPPLAVAAAWPSTPVRDALVVAGWVAAWALASRLHPQRQFWHDVLAGTRLVPA